MKWHLFIVVLLCMASVSAQSLFYVHDILLASKDPAVNYYYHDHLGSDIEVFSLPFGQEIEGGSRFGFTGKEKDASGLMFYGARYYDPGLGRFTRLDPVDDGPVYAYVQNNPLRFTDPTGMYTFGDLNEWIVRKNAPSSESSADVMTDFSSGPADLSTEFSTYDLGERETFFGAYRMFGADMSYDDFKSLNSHIENIDNLQVGATIRIPKQASIFDKYPVLNKYKSFIRAAAEKYQVNENFIGAIMYQETLKVWPESGYKQVSRAGAVGLMQVKPATAAEYGYSRQDLFDPEKNIDAGTRYLKEKLIKYQGSYDLAAAAYNGGNGVANAARVGTGITRRYEMYPGMFQYVHAGYHFEPSKAPDETKGYVRNVLNYLQ